MEMNARFIVCVLAVAAICSCSGDSPTGLNDPSIFPLAVGNRWAGSHTHFDANGEIIKIDTTYYSILRDTIMSNERWFLCYDPIEILRFVKGNKARYMLIVHCVFITGVKHAIPVKELSIQKHRLVR